MLFTDWNGFWRHNEAEISHMEWRDEDRRNWLGLKPELVLPTLAVTVGVTIFYWPDDGRLETFAQKIGPSALVEMAREVNGGPYCAGPGYPPGGAKCREIEQEPNLAGGLAELRR